MYNAPYLFVAGLFPKETEKEILKNSKGFVQNAANVLQWNLVEGFNTHLGKKFSILNAPYIGSFPKRYKKLFIKAHKFSHIKEVQDYNVGFCNLTGFKRFFIRNSLKKQIKKWIKSKKRKALIAYAMTDPSMQSIVYAKKLDPTIKTCLIVPDLPQYMSHSRSSARKLFKKIDWNSIKEKIKYVDTFVLLTHQMANFLGVNNYVVMEGISSDIFDNITVEKRTEKTVMYSGTLSYRYGIGELLKAFELIKDKDYRLIICGAGEAETEIRQLQKKDSRIEFKGLLPREEVLVLQKSSTVLVNPRQNKGEYTKYSFPSKIMEYLSSGTPVVAYKLDGMGDEYGQHIHYVVGDRIQDLTTAITDICELSTEQREEIGQKAQKFVLNEKNANAQTKKILNVLLS